MYESLKYHIRGLTPTLMHNGRLSNPLDPFAKAIKEFSGKRKKTDADHHAMAKLEWEGSLYLDANGHPAWPGENIEAGLCEAAKKLKLGKQFKAGLLSDGVWPLIYDGPKTIAELAADPRFIDTRRVVVKTSSVQRTRPIFHEWELKFTVSFMADMLNAKEIDQVLGIMGTVIGLSDHRPRYGRFEILSEK